MTKRKQARRPGQIAPSIIGLPTRVGGVGPIIVAGTGIFLFIGLFIAFVAFSGRDEKATQTAAPTTIAAAPVSAAAQERMAAAVAQARHFKGDDNAPVTIIEISEFT